MPVVGQRDAKDVKARRVAEALAAEAAFAGAFRRSAKGNLWRPYGEGDGVVTLSVFRRPSDGRYAYGVTGGDEGPRWSPDAYGSEADAVFALWWELEGWGWDGKVVVIK
jgi:hypothetical protein